MGRRVRSLSNHQPPLDAEIDRLDTLILAERAETVGDIAVQAAHALYLADIIAAEAEFVDPALAALAKRRRHTQASIVLTATSTVGFPVEAIGWPDLRSVCRRELLA